MIFHESNSSKVHPLNHCLYLFNIFIETDDKAKKEEKKTSPEDPQDSEHNKTVTIATDKAPGDATTPTDKATVAEKAAGVQDICQTLSKMITDKLETGKEAAVKAEGDKETVEGASVETREADKDVKSEVTKVVEGSDNIPKEYDQAAMLEAQHGEYFIFKS